MTAASTTRSLRAIFYEQLHCTYERHQFDNWLVWAGNHAILIDGIRYSSTLARAYIGAQRPAARAKVRAELFLAAVEPEQVLAEDVDARLWTDANARGFVDAKGTYQDDPGRYLPMHLVCDPLGAPELSGNNLVFESEEFTLDRTGVFSYTAEFSADNHVEAGRKEWVSLNDMADNRNGVIVVSPEWVRNCPSITEVCPRKVGAKIEKGEFRSGRLRKVTSHLQSIPTDVVYLLPFFKPGFKDLHTGEDVRKGTLGSVYAVQDFFQIDPELISPPEEVELARLVQEGLITDEEVEGLPVKDRAELAEMSMEKAIALVGREELTQLIGRAELRQLTGRAHALGKKVIFDLVLMQTSRDSPLIKEHPEWYVLDENGVPKIHQIAWLVYSDVALFDLVFNYPLQNYLLEIAPYWIEKCDLDGVRIDASQTVDRPFLKKIKNRINTVRPDALILGETLCPLEEAVDIPVDMIYALLVDFHRDVESARPLIGFLEEMHQSFAPGTVAMGYFENHDSPRATQVWQDKYEALLREDERARACWKKRGDGRLMALLKNLQASLIDLSAGAPSASNLAYGLELGSEWGEPTRTDFEHETLLDFGLRQRPPHAALRQAYERLHQLKAEWPELRCGQVYYQRSEFDGGDPQDRVLGYVRYTGETALLLLHNFDPAQTRQVTYTFDCLPWRVEKVETLFDTYEALQVQPLEMPLFREEEHQGNCTFHLSPLQSRMLRLRAVS